MDLCMANSTQLRKHVYFIFFSLTMVRGICCQIRSSSDDSTFSSNRNRTGNESPSVKRPGPHAVSCNREVKIPRFRFTSTGDIHVPVPVNREITCNLRNPRYSGVRKPIREWQLSLLRFAINC
jgi:hypothetical protein